MTQTLPRLTSFPTERTNLHLPAREIPRLMAEHGIDAAKRLPPRSA